MPDSDPLQAKTARLRSGGRKAAAPGAPLGAPAFPVVGIGASAGGLEACRKLIGALPEGNGMAFILVQHLDPTHESMMVDLLLRYTTMPVRQAADGMTLEPDHLYVIPPATYLSVKKGALQAAASRVAPSNFAILFVLCSHLLDSIIPRQALTWFAPKGDGWRLPKDLSVGACESAEMPEAKPGSDIGYGHVRCTRCVQYASRQMHSPQY